MIVEVGGGGKVAQTMYAHVSKCKNDKIKKKLRKKDYDYYTCYYIHL
jgi:hypothetical protein